MKSIVVFGGSSDLGQNITKELADNGHSVTNIDTIKSEVEGVTRYPFDGTPQQTKGILGVLSPDIIVNCNVIDDTNPSNVIQYLTRLLAVMEHCADQEISKVVLAEQSNSLNQTISNIDSVVSGTQIIITDTHNLSNVIKDEMPV